MRSAILALVLASVAGAQAAPNTSIALVAYNALKNRVRPSGDLAVQIAFIDSVIAIAQRRGHTAEVRRQVAKGSALLGGRVWADTNDYRQSLVLRAERVFVDASLPYVVRLEQTFAPDIVTAGPLTARASLRSFRTPNAAPSPLGEFSDVGRDLRDSPRRMELNLAGSLDGSYAIQVEVSDSVRPLGSAILRVTVVNNLSTRLAALEAKAAAALPVVRPSLRYPADYARKMDRGIIPVGAFDLARELALAESLATVAGKRTNPFVRRTGGFERHYLLESAGEIMPYRVFVPTVSGRNAALSEAKGPRAESRGWPLIIALHGLGGNEDSFMDGYDSRLPQLAQERGYIVATPLGYRIDGGYGSPILGGRAGAPSEADVIQVLARMRADYKIDSTRIYLMGHSMGGIGTWHLGAKYPQIWAALAPFSGIGVPRTAATIKHIPQFIVHGDADNTVNVQRSRDMVAALQQLGADYKYIEVPGGGHNDVVVPNLAAMFDFFDAKRKPTP
jgi:predicted esterase